MESYLKLMEIPTLLEEGFWVEWTQLPALGMRIKKKMKNLAFKDLKSYTEEQIPSWVQICFLDLSEIRANCPSVSEEP